MAKASLILLLLLSGCQSITERAERAADAKGRVQASTPFPDLPSACTAKMGRVKPGNDPWVVTVKRWDTVADIRDRQASDCALWGADMKTKAR